MIWIYDDRLVDRFRVWRQGFLARRYMRNDWLSFGIHRFADAVPKTPEDLDGRKREMAGAGIGGRECPLL